MKPTGHRTLRLSVFVAFLVFAFYTWGLLTQPSEYFLHYHGNFLDADVSPFIAGLSYAHCGFLKLKLMPTVHRFTADCAYGSADFYGHCPPGPHLMSGAYQVLGIHSLIAQKLLLYIVSAVSVLFLVLSLARIVALISTQSRQVAIWAVPAIVLASPWFIYWTSTLLEYSYRDFFMFLGLWLLLTDRLRGYAVAAFLLGFFSYEVMPMMFAIGGAKLWFDFSQHRLSARQAAGYLVLFILAPTASFGLHFFQYGWYLGGLDKAMADLVHIGLHRAGVGATSSYSVAVHVVKQAYATLWYYGSALLVLAGIGAVVCFRKRQWWPVALLAAGMVWQVLMRQFCAVHALAVRQFGLGIIALGAVGLAFLLEHPGKKPPRLGIVLLWLSVLRLPLGAEFSNNPIFIKAWQAAIAKTDSATLANLLYDAKATFEHRPEKSIVIRELARRNSVAPDAPAYEFVWSGTTFVQRRHPGGIEQTGIPKDLLPKLRDEPHPYTDEVLEAQLNWPGAKPVRHEVAPVRIEIAGTPNRRRLMLLNFVFRFI